MKIRKVTGWLLRVPCMAPLMKETHVLANFVEVETDDGLQGHALAGSYPLKHGIREFINRDVAPVIQGMDPMRTEDVRSRLLWATASNYFAGVWNCAASLIDIALWDIKGRRWAGPYGSCWAVLTASFRPISLSGSPATRPSSW